MSSRPLTLCLAFAFVSPFTQAKEAPQWCDIPIPNNISSSKCSDTEFMSISVDDAGLTEGNENPCTFIKSCQPAHKPPSDVTLQCVPASTGNGFLCGAWPRGKTTGEFTYDWFATGTLAVDQPGPGPSPEQVLDCTGDGGGFVSVVVTSPFGLSTTGVITLDCAN